MLPFNYHHLYYFWVAAKEGSLTRAREKLLLAQPTLSLQIGQLERFFGKKLLTRSRQGVALTAAGSVAFGYAERIFTQGEALTAALLGPPSSPPALRVGVTKALAREIVLRLLDAARALEPAARITIFTGSPEELHDRLRRHALDLTVSEEELSSSLGSAFKTRRVASVPLVLVAAPRMKLPRSKDGGELRVLLRTPDHPLRREVEQYLSRRKIRYAIEAEVEDADLLRQLAIQGRGAAALNALAVRRDLADGRLRRLHRGPTGILEHVWFSSSAHPHPDAGVQRVLQGLMTRFEIRGLA